MSWEKNQKAKKQEKHGPESRGTCQMGLKKIGPGCTGSPLQAMARSLHFVLSVIRCHLEAAESQEMTLTGPRRNVSHGGNYVSGAKICVFFPSLPHRVCSSSWLWKMKTGQGKGLGTPCDSCFLYGVDRWLLQREGRKVSRDGLRRRGRNGSSGSRWEVHEPGSGQEN